MLAILIEGGGAHAVQLAASQHRLEEIAGIHGPFRLAGTDHGMQLVDEQNDLPFGVLDLFKHGFEALFKLTTIFRTGDQGTHIEGDDALLLQSFGDIAAHDALGQALDDGRLAHARFTDEHRVVLGATRQDLDHPANFLIAADDRIELALLGQLG
jgi:hypothetical protein